MKDNIINLLNKSKSNLDYFYKSIDTVKLEELIIKLNSCNGTIFFTGVGKSGIIANKVSSTLTSLGISSSFICPMNALHGDSGKIKDNDIVVLFSKSGKSNELISFIRGVRKKHIYFISVVCEINSNNKSIINYSNNYMILPLIKELGAYQIPTTSSEVQLIFGNIITTALVDLKRLTYKEFTNNHPANNEDDYDK